MIPFFRQSWIILKKDLISELREPYQFLSILLFGLLLLLLFSFALSSEPELMRRMAAGLFWLATFFASTLSLDHSLRKERIGGQWEGLLLLGGDPKALYLGKMFANLVFVLLLQLVLLPTMAILYDISFPLSVLGPLILGSLGIVALGTLYAGLTASLREGQLLLPLLLFPMLVPILLASVKTTEFLFLHDVFEQGVAWLKLLVVFDIVFLIGSLWCADSLFEGN